MAQKPVQQKLQQSALDQVLGYIRGVALGTMHPEHALQQAGNLLGGILGIPSQKPTKPVPIKPVTAQQRQQLETQHQQAEAQMVRDAVLKQTAYTPQAAAYLKSLPLVPYGLERMSSVRNERTGGQYSGSGFNMDSDEAQPEVALNMRYVQPNPGPVTTLRHEFVHALDRNANWSPPASFPNTGMHSGDSANFFNSLMQYQPRIAKAIEKHMYPTTSTPIYGKNPRTQDIESYAYHGAKGPEVLLNKNIGPRYKDIYLPMSKAVNQSFKYPAIEQQRIWEE